MDKQTDHLLDPSFLVMVVKNYHRLRNLLPIKTVVVSIQPIKCLPAILTQAKSHYSHETNHRLRFSSFSDGYDSSRHSRQDLRANETPSSYPYRSVENLARGAVDLVSRNRLLRYCQLYSGPGQAFGFQLKADDDKHIVHNIQPDSPASMISMILCQSSFPFSSTSWSL